MNNIIEKQQVSITSAEYPAEFNNREVEQSSRSRSAFSKISLEIEWHIFSQFPDLKSRNCGFPYKSLVPFRQSSQEFKSSIDQFMIHDLNVNIKNINDRVDGNGGISILCLSEFKLQPDVHICLMKFIDNKEFTNVTKLNLLSVNLFIDCMRDNQKVFGIEEVRMIYSVFNLIMIYIKKDLVKMDIDTLKRLVDSVVLILMSKPPASNSPLFRYTHSMLSFRILDFLINLFKEKHSSEAIKLNSTFIKGSKSFIRGNDVRLNLDRITYLLLLSYVLKEEELFLITPSTIFENFKFEELKNIFPLGTMAKFLALYLNHPELKVVLLAVRAIENINVKK